VAKVNTPSGTMPLYPSEEQIAHAVLGPRHARRWPGLAAVLERQGLPRIDPQFGGRYWPAVREFLDRRHRMHHDPAGRGQDRA
jgi:hypothetical protein